MGTLQGYPTYVGETEEGIVIVGYSPMLLWKHTTPTWPYHFIAHLPQTILIGLIFNLLLLSLVFLYLARRLITSIKPIINGIKKLSINESVHLPENTILADVERQINQTSQTLESHRYLLDKKDDARNKWITGVSHDIRTPLAIAMINADKLSHSRNLNTKEKSYASDMLKQGEIIKQLINDLNLATKLEYSGDAIEFDDINLNSLIRKVTAGFLNNPSYSKPFIALDDSVSETNIMIRGNERLLSRALMNIINNSLQHNEEMCMIYIKVKQEDQSSSIIIEDDGASRGKAKYSENNSTKQYEDSDDIGRGLGLKIVDQIMKIHDGKLVIGQSEKYFGYKTELIFNHIENRKM